MKTILWMISKITTFSVLFGLSTAIAGENDQGNLQGDYTAYFGNYNVSNGLADRGFGGLIGNFYTNDGLGFHIEAAGQWREEDAGFVSVGVSKLIVQELRSKITFGTSSDNQGIFPEFMSRVSLDYDFGPENGILANSALTYRNYRNGVDEISVQGSMIKYFEANQNGSYIVGQIDASGTWANPGSNFGWELSGGVTNVMPSGWTVGLNAAFGVITYDTLVQGTLKNEFFAVRPTVSYRIPNDAEIYARGEFFDSEHYDMSGVMLGIKFNLP